mmetsp:Transcript_4613/g.6463  ORF Transcript_4613/g.6463 Transcript_4613/m.6463 type:complete len:133 (-) Transcript_4613:75-473(-)
MKLWRCRSLVALLVCTFLALVVDASVLSLRGGKCPSTSNIQLPIGKSATGNTIWSKPFTFAGGAPQPIGRTNVTEARICGYGRFVFSPMSCTRISYAPDTFEQSKAKVTVECKVVALDRSLTAGLGCILVEC